MPNTPLTTQLRQMSTVSPDKARDLLHSLMLTEMQADVVRYFVLVEMSSANDAAIALDMGMHTTCATIKKLVKKGFLADIPIKGRAKIYSIGFNFPITKEIGNVHSKKRYDRKAL